MVPTGKAHAEEGAFERDDKAALLCSALLCLLCFAFSDADMGAPGAALLALLWAESSGLVRSYLGENSTAALAVVLGATKGEVLEFSHGGSATTLAVLEDAASSVVNRNSKGKKKNYTAVDKAKLQELTSSLLLCLAGVRTAILIDANFPLPVLHNPALLVEILNKVQASTQGPCYVVEVANDGSIFVINRAKLRARLWAHDEPLFVEPNDVGQASLLDCPNFMFPNLRILYRALQGSKSTDNVLRVDLDLGEEITRLVALAGWLLDYPVSYSILDQSGRGLGPQALQLWQITSNALSSHPLLSFTVPAPLATTPTIRVALYQRCHEFSTNVMKSACVPAILKADLRIEKPTRVWQALAL